MSRREEKRGRKVEAAMQQIPIAGSIMDQIETLETAKRKSGEIFTRRTYSIRMITVKPALLPFISYCFRFVWRGVGGRMEGKGRGTYMIPRARRQPTTILAFRFMFRFQITVIGRMPKIISVTAAKTA